MRAEDRECRFADAEVRDWNAAGADTALPRVGGNGGAAAGAGPGQESDGGEFRPQFNTVSSLRRRSLG